MAGGPVSALPHHRCNLVSTATQTDLIPSFLEVTKGVQLQGKARKWHGTGNRWLPDLTYPFFPCSDHQRRKLRQEESWDSMQGCLWCFSPLKCSDSGKEPMRLPGLKKQLDPVLHSDTHGSCFLSSVRGSLGAFVPLVVGTCCRIGAWKSGARTGLELRARGQESLSAV